MHIQSECVTLITYDGNLSNWQRRNSFCDSCSHPNEAIDPLLFSPTSTAHPEMDETLSNLTASRNGNRSCSREIRTGSRECPPPAATHHSSATDQTTNMHEGGSVAPRPPGKDGRYMETSALHRATRNPSALASSGLSPLLEAEVKAEVNTSEGGSPDHRVDQRDGKEQSTLGSGTDPWRVTETRYPRL